jgi:hypothetical protein
MRRLAVPILLAAGLAAPAGAQTLVVRPEVCAALVAHVPDPGVAPGPAYVPGIDAAGRPVAPADLPAAPGAAAFEEIAVKLTVDLKRRFGIPADDRFIGEAELGYVTVRDGRAFLNGAPLAAEADGALAALCRHGWRDPPRR